MNDFAAVHKHLIIVMLLLTACVGVARGDSSSGNTARRQTEERPARRVLLIPIDDRPAVTQFTEMIGRVADVEVVMPPRPMLGSFARGGNPEAIIAWLRRQNLRDIDAAILSVDMLAYGGLMTSRTNATPLDVARRRLDVIKELRRRNPRLPIYAFNAVQRVALSATAANRAYRDRLARWVVLAHQTTVDPNPQLKIEFDQLTRELPPAALEDYRRARNRNLSVNLQMLELAKTGAIDELLLLQDDALPYGLHRLDQQTIRERMRALSLSDAQAKLYNGADEGSSVLLSRAILRREKFTPLVKVVYSSEAGKRATGTYEDQTIERSVERQLAGSGARMTEADGADYTLYVNAPEQTEGEFADFLARMIADVKAGKRVAIADVFFKNHWGGSDNRIVGKLVDERLLDRLTAYASWNTPGNTLGTAIPQANLYTLTRRKFTADPARAARREVAQAAFLLHRYVGDYGYHTIVRPEINRHARRDLKIETDELNEPDYARLDRLVRERMTTVATDIFDKNFANRFYRTSAEGAERRGITLRAMRDLEVRLPWSRTFEVSVNYNLDYDFTSAPSVVSATPADEPRATKNVNEDEALWVEETLRSLSLRERVGQLIVVGAIGEYKNFRSEKFADVLRQVEGNKVGGVVFYRGDVNELAALTNEMQRRASVPLLIAADFERGLPMQIKSGTSFTHNMGVAAAGDAEAAFREGRIIAREMRAVGVHWLFAPVADVLSNPGNTMVNVRSFGENPRTTARYVSAFVRGVHAGGALATAKHFPGHGDTEIDSHIALPVLEFDRERLDAVELAPFRAAIDAGVDSIMTAHIALPRVTGDRLPASLSPMMNTDLLRRQLKFDGIITTDSLGMNAITKSYTPAESALLAIKAGADVALLPPDPKAAIDRIEAAVRSGELTEARIDQSVRRILRAKYRAGLARTREVDLNAVNLLVEEPESVREADETAARALTLLRNRGEMLPLDSGSALKTLFIVIAGDADADQGRVLQTEIESRVKGARIIRIDSRTTPAEYEQAATEARRAESVVIAPFVKRAALKGTIALPDAQAEFVRRVARGRERVAVVAFGSPYQLQQFPEANVYLVTYAVEDVAQRAAARAIFGETAIRGRAPVSLPGLFKIGDGLTTLALTPSDKGKTNEALPHN